MGRPQGWEHLGRTQASARAIMNTLGDLSLSEVAGKRHNAFLNVNVDVLMNDMTGLNCSPKSRL